MSIESPPVRLITAIAIAIANFMIILDTTIAVVSVPAIAGGIGATPSQGTWVLTSYTVCIAVVLPLSGWVSTRYGEVRTFTAAIVMFAVTSWLCGITRNFELLVLLRALQGLASGLVVPLSQTLLLRIYPPVLHGVALSLWTITASVAPVAGPILGGVITDQFGWPWIFFINVPIALVCGYVVWQRMRAMESPGHKQPVDGVGIVLLVCCIITLQLAMDRGEELDWLGSPIIRLWLVVAFISFVGFCVWERREPHPIVDFTLFRARSFTLSSLMIGIFYVTYIATTVMQSIWMQTVLDYTPTLAGIALAGSGLPPVLGMYYLGKHIYRINLRWLVVIGSLCVVGAVYMQAQMQGDITLGYLIVARVILGAGLGTLFVPLMSLSLIGLPKSKTATAAGLFNFFRMVASSMGIAIGVTIWDHRTIFHHQRLVENLNPFGAAGEPVFALVGRLGGGDPLVSWSMVEHLVERQASTLGLNDTFFMLMATFIVVLVLTPLLPRRIAPRMVAADG